MVLVIMKVIIKFAYVIVQREKMIKIYYEIEELDDRTIQIGCREDDKIEFLNEIEHGCKRKMFMDTEDIKSLIEYAYNKYVVPDNVNGINTEHVVIGGVRFKTLVNHPISAMRAEFLEQLEANQKKDLPEEDNISSTKDKQD